MHLNSRTSFSVIKSGVLDLRLLLPDNYVVKIHLVTSSRNTQDVMGPRGSLPGYNATSHHTHTHTLSRAKNVPVHNLIFYSLKINLNRSSLIYDLLSLPFTPPSKSLYGFIEFYMHANMFFYFSCMKRKI